MLDRAALDSQDLDSSRSLCAPGATIPPELPAGCDLDAGAIAPGTRTLWTRLGDTLLFDASTRISTLPAPDGVVFAASPLFMQVIGDRAFMVDGAADSVRLAPPSELEALQLDELRSLTSSAASVEPLPFPPRARIELSTPRCIR